MTDHCRDLQLDRQAYLARRFKGSQKRVNRIENERLTELLSSVIGQVDRIVARISYQTCSDDTVIDSFRPAAQLNPSDSTSNKYPASHA